MISEYSRVLIDRHVNSRLRLIGENDIDIWAAWVSLLLRGFDCRGNRLDSRRDIVRKSWWQSFGLYADSFFPSRQRTGSAVFGFAMRIDENSYIIAGHFACGRWPWRC